MEQGRSILLTREQCRAVDRYAIEVLGIPGIVLMENAGRSVAEYIVRLTTVDAKLSTTPTAAILCGRGNNGGDGFVVARHLLRCGWDVFLYLAAEPGALTGDASINYAPLEKLAVPCAYLDNASTLAAAAPTWEYCDVVVDALLGTGFQSAVREPLAGIIAAINNLHRPQIVAVDVPSGLDADTGQPVGSSRVDLQACKLEYSIVSPK